MSSRFFSLRHIGVGFALAVVSIFLIANARYTDPARHNRIIANLSEIEKLNSDLNEVVLKIRYGLVNNYDPLVATLNRIKRRQRELETGDYAIAGQGDDEIDIELAAFSRALGQKETLIERFKFGNALLKNSFYYVPLAVAAASASGVPRELQELLQSLLREVLLLHVASSREGYEQVSRDLARVQAARDRYPEAAGPRIELVIQHVQNILLHQGEMEKLIARITAGDIKLLGTKLTESYHRSFDRGLRRADIYRIFLSLASLGLLAYAIYSFLRLREGARRERDQERVRLEQVEREVAVRTEELSDANAGLTDSLAQQTATSEVLQVISSSPTDTQPVFGMIVRRAMQLCDGQFCAVFHYDGELIHLASHHGLSPEDALAYERGFPAPPSRVNAIGRAISDRTTAQIPDIRADPEYWHANLARAVTFGSVVAVPLLRDGQPIGGIAMSRRAAGVFPGKHIDLLHTFADQAVIAIENVRLFNEVKTRTEALTHSVEEMRALGEVGQAVSSTLDLDTVLITIITHAVELSGADGGGTIYEFDEAAGVFVPRASHGVSEAMVASLRDTRIRLGESSVGICAAQRAPFQTPDVGQTRNDPVRELLLREGINAVLAVPLLREERVVGALAIRRRTAGEFSESVLTLLQNFAGQSVLAIQNARLFHEVREKSRELEIASQLKSQFLANMSHELRTPLNAIIGVTEMLREDAIDLKREHDIEPLDRVLRAARHLLALINDILDLSKIEAGKIDIHLEQFAIEPLVKDVVQTIATMAAKNGNKVVMECALDIGTMNADQTRIRQALLNLVSNASKFTEKGTVTIDARRGFEGEREWVTLAVSDTGIGLTTEQMGALFQDFVQADASITRKYGGTGLGLAISRRFCQMLGGDITVTSEPGRGSTFTIRVPADCATLSAAAAARDAAAPRPVAAQSGGSTILVVDDDETVRELMQRFLTREGFSVVTASGGREGLRLARELHPAAITLDVMMPDLDGWTVLAAIKGDPELADIPVILMTIVDEKNRGYALGATDYMVKPVDRERLSAALRGICGAVGRRVLLVDDDDVLRQGMRLALEKDGWDVIEAENGRVALERLDDKRPDIIMLDLMMPIMDGFEFLIEMRKEAEWRDIPVLVVTARDLTAEERNHLNGGVQRILQKGGTALDEVLREIGRILPGTIARGRGRQAAEEAA